MTLGQNTWAKHLGKTLGQNTWAKQVYKTFPYLLTKKF
jgi:hypothetical protein